MIDPTQSFSWTVPGHVILTEIARGGMGIVYRARQLDTNRIVALKMLLPHQIDSAEMRERFRLEAKAIAALDHPSILPVYQVGEHERQPFFTMKYVGGGMLATRQDAYRGQFQAIATLMITLADAVQFAHERGVLHRDLKPSNILFDEAGHPYISDFGLAKFIDTDNGLTRSDHFLGTPHYMAPEILAQCSRFATTASDIYSLGAILYELLIGRPPFEAEGMPALLRKITEEEPAVMTSSRSHRTDPGTGSQMDLSNGVSRDLAVIALKCLAKEPARRYVSARELADDLRRWMNGQPILARAISWRERWIKWAKRNPSIAVLTSLLVLVLCAGTGVLAWSNQQLQQALEESHTAHQDSLIVQARLERKSRQLGQRSLALDLIDRALALPPSAGPPDPIRHMLLRSEAAGALALPDLRILGRWPVHSSSPESAIAFTGDLAYYAAPALDGGFQIWDARDHRILCHFPGKASIPAVRFKFSCAEAEPSVQASPGIFASTCHWVAAIFQDGHVEAHDLSRKQPAQQFAGSPDASTDVEFLPGTPRVLVSGHRVGLVLRGLTDGSRHDLIAPPETVTAVQADPRGVHAACLSQRMVQVLRLADGARLWSAPLPHGSIVLSWSPDGNLLAIAESVPPFEITVLDLNSAPAPLLDKSNPGAPGPLKNPGPIGNFNLFTLPSSVSNTLPARIVAHFQDHELRVSRIAFHPDGQLLASVGQDHRLVLRQLFQNGLKLFGPAGWRVLQFSKDGRRLVYEPGHGQVGLLEVEISNVFHEWRRIITPPDEEASKLAVSPKGRLVATSSASGIQLWDADARSQIAHLPFPNTSKSVTINFHPSGQAILYRPQGCGVVQVDLKFLDASSRGKLAVEFGAPRLLGANSDFLPSQDNQDSRSLAAYAPHRGHGITALSADGQWAATATADGLIEIHSITPAMPILNLPPPQPLHVHDLAFSPDRGRLYLWQSSGRLLEWDLTELRRELEKRGLNWQE